MHALSPTNGKRKNTGLYLPPTLHMSVCMNMQFLHSAYTVTTMHRTVASGHARHEWKKEKTKGSAIFCLTPYHSTYVCMYICMSMQFLHNPMSPPPRDKRLGLDSPATHQPVSTGIVFWGIYSCWGGRRGASSVNN